MASLFRRHAFGTLKKASISRACLSSTRSFHSTIPVLKKKGKADIEDLFRDDFIEDELISVTTEAKIGTSQPLPSTSTTEGQSVAAIKSKKLSPLEREQRFKTQLEYVKQRIGRKPAVKDGRLRKRAFINIIDLASSKEQLSEVALLIPKYKAGGGELVGSFGEAFVRRCQELDGADLALKVFGNYATYGINLDLSAAQWLVHSLYIKHPFSELLLATNMYPVYGLPPISEDLVTASMVAAACYKDKSPESLKIAETLRPDINAMLEKVKISRASDHATAKKNKWAAWALTRVNHATKAAGEPYVPPKLIPLKIKVEKPAAEALAQP